MARKPFNPNIRQKFLERFKPGRVLKKASYVNFMLSSRHCLYERLQIICWFRQQSRWCVSHMSVEESADHKSSFDTAAIIADSLEAVLLEKARPSERTLITETIKIMDAEQLATKLRQGLFYIPVPLDLLYTALTKAVTRRRDARGLTGR